MIPENKVINGDRVIVIYRGYPDPQPQSIEEAMERGGTMFSGWHIPFGHGTPEEKVTVTHRYRAIEAIPQKKQKKGNR